MARKARNTENDNEEPGLNISSLIDVCFLLLIYFMVAATIQALEQDVPMMLPSPGIGPGTPPDSLFIKVAPSGQIYVGPGDSQESMDSDSEDRSLPLLSQRVELYKNGLDLAGEKPVIQLYVDGDAKQQRVVDVLNCLAKYNIKAITFTDLIDE